MSFLISGFGRSGTKFLSSVMNRSEKWTVRHEPRGASDIQDYMRGRPLPPAAQEAFRQPHYGEVNSYMRYWLPELAVEQKGVITRDPCDVVLSVANRRKLTRTMVLDIVDWQLRLRQWIAAGGVTHIEFEKMTTDPKYLKWVLETFGIRDVDVAEVDLSKKVNANRSIRKRRSRRCRDSWNSSCANLAWTSRS